MTTNPTDRPRVGGLILSVARRVGEDCTLGGISSRHGELTLVGILDLRVSANPTLTPLNPRSQVFLPNEDRPAVWLVRRRIGTSDVWHLTPVPTAEQQAQLSTLAQLAGWTTRFMAGGNYAGTSDSRFSAITGFYGSVSVHDRDESRRPAPAADPEPTPPPAQLLEGIAASTRTLQAIIARFEPLPLDAGERLAPVRHVLCGLVDEAVHHDTPGAGER